MPPKRTIKFQDISECDSVSYLGVSDDDKSESNLYIHPLKVKKFIESLHTNEILA